MILIKKILKIIGDILFTILLAVLFIFTMTFLPIILMEVFP